MSIIQDKGCINMTVRLTMTTWDRQVCREINKNQMQVDFMTWQCHQLNIT